MGHSSLVGGPATCILDISDARHLSHQQWKADLPFVGIFRTVTAEQLETIGGKAPMQAQVDAVFSLASS